MSCSTTETSWYKEYISPGKDTSATKEFTCYITDSTIKRLFLNQAEANAIDTNILSYVFFDKKDRSVSSGIVYYSDNNEIQVIANSMYVADSLNSTIEIKGKLLKGGKQKLGNEAAKYILNYKFIKDSSISFNVETEIKAREIYIDSLKTKGLVINSIDKSSFDYSDNRKDTSIVSETILTYSKGRGLIKLEHINGGNSITYILTNKYYR
jgi:hypothetical protein